MLLSIWSKLFLKPIALQPQPCIYDTKPTPFPNPKALGPLYHPTARYLTLFFAGLSRKYNSHTHIPPDLALFHKAATNPSAPERSHPSARSGKPTSHLPTSSTVSRTWCSFPKSKERMTQISVLTASQTQTCLQSYLLKAARPTDRPTKMNFPDTDGQLALPVTYQEREKMCAPHFRRGGYISHTSNTLLTFYQ